MEDPSTTPVRQCEICFVEIVTSRGRGRRGAGRRLAHRGRIIGRDDSVGCVAWMWRDASTSHRGRGDRPAWAWSRSNRSLGVGGARLLAWLRAQSAALCLQDPE